MNRCAKVLAALLALSGSLFSGAQESGHIQLENITARDGLSCQAVNTLETDVQDRIWVGSPLGIDVVSNGKITRVNTISVQGSIVYLGNVRSIACGKRTVIAADNHLVDYDFDRNESFFINHPDGSGVVTGKVIVDGENVFFFDQVLNRLCSYSFETRQMAILGAPERADIILNVIDIKKMGDNHFVLLDPERGVLDVKIDQNSMSGSLVYDGEVSAMELDNGGILWIANHEGKVMGLVPEGDFKQNKSFEIEGIRDITFMNAMPDGRQLMVCTNSQGSFLLDVISGRSVQLEGSVLNNVTCVLAARDRQEIIFGTAYDGIVLWKRSFIYSMSGPASNSMQRLLVPISAVQDGYGMMWFGTDGSGIIRYDEKDGESKTYPETDFMRINSLCEYGEGQLLFNSDQGTWFFDKVSGIKTRSFMEDGERQSFYSLNNASSILCCNGIKGHRIVNLKDGSAEYLDLSLAGLERNSFIDAVLVEPSYAVISSGGSLVRLDYGTNELRLLFKSQDVGKHSFKSLAADSKKRIWFIEPDRILRYDPATDKTETLHSSDQYGEYCSICVDQNDKIWISTYKGILISYDSYNDVKMFFTNEDGVVSREFLHYFTLSSKKTGNMYFPSTSGLMVVGSDNQISTKRTDHTVRCYSLMVDGEFIDLSVHDGEKPVSLSGSSGTVQARFIIDSSNAFRTHLMRFLLEKDGELAYSVEGSDMTFNLPRLSHGEYLLKTSYLSTNGWTQPQTSLVVDVRKPPYQSAWVIIALMLLLTATVANLVLVRVRRQRRKNEAEMLRQKNSLLEDRVRFQTSIAHEIKTPLSLVTNYLTDEREGLIPDSIHRDSAENMFRQVEKMSDMVNLILQNDRSKLEGKDLMLEEVSLNEWVGDTALLFKSEAVRKGLIIDFQPAPSDIVIDTDVKVLETAFNNLMSNALKYSRRGIVTVGIKPVDDKVDIFVKDQGRGFKCDSETLFKRDFRENKDVKGNGIGLSHSRELLRMLGGDITAESDGKSGSVFTLHLPVQPENIQYKSAVEIVPRQINDDVEFDTTGLSLLFVDDSKDIQKLIKYKFEFLFKVIYIANNGREALDIANERKPDVVISDIAMPRMDGFDLCKSLRDNPVFEFTPIILLTSQSDAMNQNTGLSAGADAFMAKPFDANTLFKLIKILLKKRHELKHKYARVIEKPVTGQSLTNADERFMLKVRDFITENMSDPDLSVEKIADYVCISRSTLAQKMVRVLGMPAVKYIRKVRIDHAKELLASTDRSIGDIASAVGFTEIQYFSSVFRQETGMSPSAFRNQERNN